MRRLLRAERESDAAAVHALYACVFPTSAEADLVDALRQPADPIVSLIAEDSGKIAGHILFSPVTLLSHPAVQAMGLAPTAVYPEHQRRGTGSALVRAGLEQCRLQGAVAVVVLGHPGYYTRFGFRPSTQFAIASEYDVPEEAFMVLELQAGALRGLGGTVRYHEAFCRR